MGRRSNDGISLNKLSFWVFTITAILYLVAWVLGKFGIHAGIIGWMRTIANGIVAIIVAVLAWRYVAPKQTVWKVLYLIVLLILLVFLILPAFGL